MDWDSGPKREVTDGQSIREVEPVKVGRGWVEKNLEKDKGNPADSTPDCLTGSTPSYPRVRGLGLEMDNDGGKGREVLILRSKGSTRLSINE